MTKRSYSFDLQEVTRAASSRSCFKKFLCASVIVFAICLISVLASLSLFGRGKEVKSKSSVNTSAEISSSKINVQETQETPNYGTTSTATTVSEKSTVSSKNSTKINSSTGDSPPEISIDRTTVPTNITTENSDVSSSSVVTISTTDIKNNALLPSVSAPTPTTSMLGDISRSPEDNNSTIVPSPSENEAAPQ